MDGWKEISSHLGRDVRTCQRWEKEYGLPVFRLDSSSDRSKVFSYAADIDEWLRSRQRIGQEPLSKPRFPRWLIAALLASGALTATLLLALTRSRPNPFDWKIKEGGLVFVDNEDRVLWTVDIRIPSNLVEKYYYIPGSEKLPARSLIQLVDLDNDGLNEAVVSMLHENYGERCLTVFNNNGKTSWSKKPSNDQVYAEGRITQRYIVQKLAAEDIDGDGKKEILVLWIHEDRFPSLFYIFDLEGNEIFKYNHTGILQFFCCTKQPDGHVQIFLGGTNNLLGSDAVMSMIDTRRLKSGVGPPYIWPPDIEWERDFFFRANYDIEKYTPVDPVPAYQEIYIRIPHLPMTRAQDITFLNVLNAQAGPDGFTLTVNYGRESNSYVYIDFFLDWRLKRTSTSTNYDDQYSMLLQKGVVSLDPHEMLQEIESSIRYWTGDDWSPVPVRLVFPGFFSRALHRRSEF